VEVLNFAHPQFQFSAAVIFFFLMIDLFALQFQVSFGVLCLEMLSHGRCRAIASTELLATR
jgi:hypothetical protein